MRTQGMIKVMMNEIIVIKKEKAVKKSNLTGIFECVGFRDPLLIHNRGSFYCESIKICYQIRAF